MTSGKILRKNSKPNAEPFAAFVDGLQLSTTMLCNFDFLDLQPEDSSGFMHLSIVPGTGGGRATPGQLFWQSRPWGRDLTDNCILPVGKLTTRGRIDNCVFLNFLKFVRSIKLR